MSKKRKRKGTGCSPSGVKQNGRLKRGYRWRKGRKGCAIPAKK